jgi:serine/threonine-protein kinase HipA
MAKRRALSVWMNGIRVGTWTRTAQGGQEFDYDPEWLQSPERRPISLSLPLRPAGEPYRDERVPGFFDNLLPDNRQIRERMQRRFRVPSADPFALLAEVGRDCVGAIQLLPEGDIPEGVRDIGCEALSAGDVEKILDDTLAAPMGQQDAGDLRISIAGAQEKTALLWHADAWQRPLGATPTTHIFKLPLGMIPQGIDLSTSVENEWACTRILAAYGIEVAPCEIRHFGQQKVLVVERFDRRLAADGQWIMRLPQEDFCQATGTPPALKYQSDGGPGIVEIMDILLGSERAVDDRMSFLKTQLVFWLLCAIDGHAKNFSLFLLPEGRYRLTPRYDVLSAYPILADGGPFNERRLKMAMAAIGENDRHYHWARIHYTHWLETARRCGMREFMSGLIDEVIDRTPEVVANVSAGLPPDFPPALAGAILGGVERAAAMLALQRQHAKTAGGAVMTES